MEETSSANDSKQVEDSSTSQNNKPEDTEIYEEIPETGIIDEDIGDICNSEKQINPKLLKLLSPDGSEYITIESLKSIIRTALGERFTDEEIESALCDLGVPHNEPIHYRVFLDLISMPSPSALSQIKIDYSGGESLTVEEWQEAMGRIGVNISKEEIEKILMRAKNIVDNVGAEYASSLNTKSDNEIRAEGDLTKKISDIKIEEVTQADAEDDDANEVFVDVNEDFICPE